MNSEPELKEAALALQRLATCLRDLTPRFVNLQPDGSGSPSMLALRDMFAAFPAPAEVLFIDCSDYPDNGKSFRTLIRFDMTQPRTCAVKFAASVAATDLPSHRSILEEHFGAKASLCDSICDLSLVTCWHDFNYMFLAPYDIRNEPEKCAIKFADWISMDSHFKELFLSEPDFNAKYELQPDSVLSTKDLLRINFKTGVPSSHVLRRSSLQELQEDVADIQPITQVPESIKEVIRRAKKLYVYGYFEYGFFTVAAHYAYAAMEGALKARWGESLSSPTKLTHTRDGATQEAEIQRGGFAAIEQYCEAHGWRTGKLLVNGREFPRTSTMVLNWLRDDGIITEYQKAMFVKAYLPLRNSHSHMERCSTWMPKPGAIRRAVQQINILFDSVTPVDTPLP